MWQWCPCLTRVCLRFKTTARKPAWTLERTTKGVNLWSCTSVTTWGATRWRFTHETGLRWRRFGGVQMWGSSSDCMLPSPSTLNTPPTMSSVITSARSSVSMPHRIRRRWKSKSASGGERRPPWHRNRSGFLLRWWATWGHLLSAVISGFRFGVGRCPSWVPRSLLLPSRETFWRIPAVVSVYGWAAPTLWWTGVTLLTSSSSGR